MRKFIQRIARRILRGKARECAIPHPWDSGGEPYHANGKLTYWEGVPDVTRYQFQAMTGHGERSYIDATIDKLRKLGRRNLKGLVLGCVELGSPERQFIETGLFESIDVVDFAATLLGRQAAAAEKLNLPIRYSAADLNAIVLPARHYDFIWVVGTIHHIRNLEGLFRNVNAALTTDGLFVCREYVGPDRLQFTDNQLAVANALLTCIPERYRTFANGVVKQAEKRNAQATQAELDPSEAIRSSKIPKLLRHHLDVIEYVETGGTVLSPLLNGIAYHFLNEDAAKYVRLAIEWERLLVASGELPSDYMFAVARKKVGMMPRVDEWLTEIAGDDLRDRP